jgi:hypothetical protein
MQMNEKRIMDFLKIKIKKFIDFFSHPKSKFQSFKKSFLKEYRISNRAGKGPHFIYDFCMLFGAMCFIMAFLIISFLEWMGWYH